MREDIRKVVWTYERISNLYSFWLDGMTMKEIGRSVNLTGERIRQLFLKCSFSTNRELRKVRRFCIRCQKSFDVYPSNTKKFCNKLCQIGYSKYTSEMLKQRDHDRYVKRYYGDEIFRKKLIESQKEWQRNNPVKVKAIMRRYFLKLKADPIRYKEYLLKCKEKYYAMKKRSCETSTSIS